MRFIALLLVTIFSFTNSVLAEDENPFGISLYGSFLHTERVPNALFFFDKIKDGDSFELRKALRDHDIEIVVLSSPGGSVYEGLTMAGILHDKKLTTYIPKKNLFTDGQGDCASACAYMYFAGRTRLADGKLGVHQFASKDADEKASIAEIQESAQTVVSDIAGLLGDFEVPAFVYPKMFQSREMYYFSKNEMIELERNKKSIKSETIKEINGFMRDLTDKLSQATRSEYDITSNLVPENFDQLAGVWYFDPENSKYADGAECTPIPNRFLAKKTYSFWRETSSIGVNDDFVNFFIFTLEKDLTVSLSASFWCQQGGAFNVDLDALATDRLKLFKNQSANIGRFEVRGTYVNDHHEAYPTVLSFSRTNSKDFEEIIKTDLEVMLEGSWLFRYDNISAEILEDCGKESFAWLNLKIKNGTLQYFEHSADKILDDIFAARLDLSAISFHIKCRPQSKFSISATNVAPEVHDERTISFQVDIWSPSHQSREWIVAFQMNFTSNK